LSWFAVGVLGACILATAACRNDSPTQNEPGRGVQSYWWGLRVGMSGADIGALTSALGQANACASISATLLAIPGAGPFISTLSYVYCNVLVLNPRLFDCCICRGSCEIATIYWWALLTPFLSCQ
jgi:hypothetical protein